jgi:Proteasome non-ATPase 26S subunit
LLNRNSARQKETKELKFRLIRNIADNPDAGAVIPDNLKLRMEGYLREGPFYVEVQPDVAFEGADS